MSLTETIQTPGYYAPQRECFGLSWANFCVVYTMQWTRLVMCIHVCVIKLDSAGAAAGVQTMACA